MVKVSYLETLIDGTVLDSSAKQGSPVTLGTSEMSKCWSEGVPQVKVGSKSKLICPSSLAYGTKAYPLIKPGATFVFEFELLDIAAK